MESGSYSFFYSIGTILPGYIAIVPLWLVGYLWNRFFPKNKTNQWNLPLLGSVILTILAFFGAKEYESDKSESIIMLLGFAPAFVFCWIRWRRAMRAPDSETDNSRL